MPLLQVELSLGKRTASELALIDSGSTVCVLPYALGMALGADWKKAPTIVQLVGSLGNHPAKALVLKLTVAPYPAVAIAFAWTQAPGARLILGQPNFFKEFDVCFFGARSEFQIQPRTP
jgi:hypothetical protein